MIISDLRLFLAKKCQKQPFWVRTIGKLLESTKIIDLDYQSLTPFLQKTFGKHFVNPKSACILHLLNKTTNKF